MTVNSENPVTTVNSSEKTSIQIPVELVEAFADASGVVRTVSFLYYNISDLFPGGLPGENRYSSASLPKSKALEPPNPPALC